MSRFVLIQALIKAFIVLQSIWFTDVLPNEITDLFLVLSIIMAVSLIIDFNSSIEINRVHSNEEKLDIFSTYTTLKLITGIIFSSILFFYFFTILKIKLTLSLLAIMLPFDSLSGMALVKFISIHEFKKYHLFTLLVSSVKVFLPILFYYLFNSVEIGLLFASILSLVLLMPYAEFKIKKLQKEHRRFIFGAFTIGILVNVIQKVDLFFVASSNSYWKDAFFLYNRFYEFALFPLSLVIGYMYKNIEKSLLFNILISPVQIFIGVTLIIAAAFIYSYNSGFYMLSLMVVKYSLVLMGLFLLPIYSKSSNYSRLRFSIILILVLMTRIILPTIFYFGPFVILISEFSLFLALLFLASRSRSVKLFSHV